MTNTPLHRHHLVIGLTNGGKIHTRIVKSEMNFNLTFARSVLSARTEATAKATKAIQRNILSYVFSDLGVQQLCGSVEVCRI